MSVVRQTIVKAPPQRFKGNHKPSMSKAVCRETEAISGIFSRRGIDTTCHGERFFRRCT